MLQRLYRNHVLANLAFVLVLVMGALSYGMMPRQQDPSINFNWISVITGLPGASAEDMEKRVAEVLEKNLRNLADVRFVSSVSREGICELLVRFEDIDERTFDKRVADLRRQIQNAEAELPEEATTPFVYEITTANAFPIAVVAVVGEADDENLRRQAEAVRKDLEQLKGVDKLLHAGLHDPELQVAFDPALLEQTGVPPSLLSDTLLQNFRDLAAGSLRVEDRKWLVRIEGANADPTWLAELPLMGRDQELTLGQLAQVRRGRELPRQLVRYGGRPAVMLSITKQEAANTLDLVQRVADFVEQRNRLADRTGVDLVLVDDQTEITRKALEIMQTNALLGLGMVLVVAWLFLGSRIALLTTIGIPFILAGAFWALDALGQTLNVSVLLGVVISLGMLVDDAVVVVESVYYRLQRGLDAMTAVLDSLREISLPVASAVLTTMAAFLPLLLLPGILGKFMMVIPMVVSIALAISLVEAFWMLPAHVIAANIQLARPGRVQRLRTRMLHWLRLRYTRLLLRVMRFPRLMLSLAVGLFLLSLIVVIADGIKDPFNHAFVQKLAQNEDGSPPTPEQLAAAEARAERLRAWYPSETLGFVADHGIHMDFFATDPIRLFYVNVIMPAGTPLDLTLRTIREVEDKVNARLLPGEARNLLAVAGQMFTETAPFYGDHYGQLIVSLQPAGKGMRDVDALIEAMRPAVLATPGPDRINFLRLAGGPPSSRPISVKVRGEELDEIRAALVELKQILAADPAVRDITDDDSLGQQVLHVQVNQDAALRAGISPLEVMRTVRLLVDGEVVARVQDKGEELDLRVRAASSRLHGLDQLGDFRLTAPDGTQVPLAELMQLEKRPGLANIRHYNFRRTITLEADIDKTLTDTVTANARLVEGWERIRQRYPNVDLDFSGELDDINESIDAILVLFLFGVGLMYLILGTQFGSYFQPLMILSTVPMAFTGVVAGLLITGNPMSLYTLYGVVALAGIAVNSAIVLIAAANLRLQMGMSVLHATVYAARRRVIPILITSLTTVAGLFSLATGLGGRSLLWGPVATAIVWGLVVSTVLTLFVVPLLYRQFMVRAVKD